MLAMRGWGAEDFRRASPEFLGACRWMVMVEKAMPVYEHASDIRDSPVTAENAQAKANASTMLPEWDAWLFPEDDDG